MSVAVLLVALPGALVYEGQELTPAEAIAAAREHLVAAWAGNAWATHDIDRRIALGGTHPVQAWWGGPAVGFAGADHPGAIPVTVVNL